MNYKKIGITAVAALAIGASGCGDSKWDNNAQPTQNDALGQKLVTQFLNDLSAKNTADLTAFLAPNFQLMRGDGTGADKKQYLADLPTQKSFKLGPVHGLEYGGTLSATYTVTSNLTVDGKAFASAPTPRLSVFVKNGDGQWHLVGHGNFNKPK
jgi:hypothetical protein